MAEYVCGSDIRPLIPNGFYEAQCYGYDSSFVLGKSRKLFVHFRIVDLGEYQGKEIFEAFNIPYDQRIRPGSKYYKTWVMVNGWRRPSRNSKMSPRLFLNKIFRIKVRTVRPRHNGREMPQQFWYSCVDEIVEILAG